MEKFLLYLINDTQRNSDLEEPLEWVLPYEYINLPIQDVSPSYSRDLNITKFFECNTEFVFSDLEDKVRRLLKKKLTLWKIYFDKLKNHTGTDRYKITLVRTEPNMPRIEINIRSTYVKGLYKVDTSFTIALLCVEIDVDNKLVSIKHFPKA